MLINCILLSVFSFNNFLFFTESEFVEDMDIIDKTAYLIIATSLVRFKYYHAWLLADAICNASGLGFNGYDKNGNARWDLISNVDVIKFEVGDLNGFVFVLQFS